MAKIERMAVRLIQPMMRFTLALFLLALALPLGASASYATAMSPGFAAPDSDEVCRSQLQNDCRFMCQPASAIARAREQIAANPLPSFLDGGIPGGKPAAIWRETWSPIATIAPGPPAYLSFRRLLL